MIMITRIILHLHRRRQMTHRRRTMEVLGMEVPLGVTLMTGMTMTGGAPMMVIKTPKMPGPKRCES